MTATEPPADALLGLLERVAVEDEVLVAARERAEELGARPVTPGTGAALRFLAATTSARAVVEVGTGAGVSGVWLLRGLGPDAVLTTLDSEPEHLRAARRAFADAGYPAGRVRLINGQAHEVLPRLTDGGYDLVVVDAGPAAAAELGGYLAEALRLLRPGGVVVLHGALAGGRVGEPTHRDPTTVALREVLRTVTEDERLAPLLLPHGDGLLAAARIG
ncbi:O-methyltransferase [Rhodococcus aerolatus]